MAGTLTAIPLAPFGSVVCDDMADWESPIVPSAGFRGGAFVLTIIGIVGPAPALDANLETSNDGINWNPVGAGVGWMGLNATGRYTIWPTDLQAYYRIRFHLSSGGGSGTTGAVTYGVVVNLKDT